MRLTATRKDTFLSALRNRLLEEQQRHALLPMPHRIESISSRGKISFEEWSEWAIRHELHTSSHPAHEGLFRRPHPGTVANIITLLGSLGLDIKCIYPSQYKTFIDDNQCERRRHALEQATVVILGIFISKSAVYGVVTYTQMFNDLCRYFSDHHLARWGITRNVRDMLERTVKLCRRDLVLCGVSPNLIWRLTTDWPDNPLYRVETRLIKGRSLTRLLPATENAPALQHFNEILLSDRNYRPPTRHGLSLRRSNEAMREDRWKRQRVCAERPYETVELGPASHTSLQAQEGVTLIFDSAAFNDDYERALKTSQSVRDNLISSYGVDPDLPKVWLDKVTKPAEELFYDSPRAYHIFFRSLDIGLLRNKRPPAIQAHNLRTNAVLFQFARFVNWHRRYGDRETAGTLATWQDYGAVELGAAFNALLGATDAWRNSVKALCEQYDNAKRHVTAFRAIRLQVIGEKYPITIRSAFQRLSTRRYQPLDLWPTYVSSKNMWAEQVDFDDGDDRDNSSSSQDSDLASLRDRWFKCLDTAGEPCPLVGFDVSSSQMQIIATFIGDASLEEASMSAGASFKERMAALAWRMQQPGVYGFRAGGGSITSYSGEADPRLIGLVKELIMSVSYGSAPAIVEAHQNSRPREYGPGWQTGSASTFMKMFDNQYPSVRTFRGLVQNAAEESYKRNKCEGLVLTDPFDGAQVRWNPVLREEVVLRSDGNKVIISLPSGLHNYTAHPNEKGDYPVDLVKLRRKAAPCIVHMLDSYYSSLVMRILYNRGVSTFVGIHDCWLVSSDHVKSLEDAMLLAAAEWYAGLECVYDDLESYVGNTGRYGRILSNARDVWTVRRESGWKPMFRAKRVGKEGTPPTGRAPCVPTAGTP